MTTATGQGKKLRLTVFLMKDGYKNIDDFLQVAQLQKVPVTEGGTHGTLYFKSGFESRPPWASVFEGVPGFNPKAIVNRGSRALYILKVDGRWFCFTFGYARHLIAESAVERNFGLIVALNLGDPDAIKAIDTAQHVRLRRKHDSCVAIHIAGHIWGGVPAVQV